MKTSLRLASFASAACLSLSTLVVAADSSPPPTADKAAEPASSAAVSNEAAAKHAKRTACLKNAKDKKLVGADKSEFLKHCIAAPADGP